MTWNQHRDWIGATCTADGPNCFSSTNLIGDLAIAQRLAATDTFQYFPDALLEIGAGGQIEGREFSDGLTSQGVFERMSCFFMPTTDLRLNGRVRQRVAVSAVSGWKAQAAEALFGIVRQKLAISRVDWQFPSLLFGFHIAIHIYVKIGHLLTLANSLSARPREGPRGASVEKRNCRRLTVVEWCSANR